MVKNQKQTVKLDHIFHKIHSRATEKPTHVWCTNEVPVTVAQTMEAMLTT